MFGIELYDNTCSINLDKLIKSNNKLFLIVQNIPLLVPTRDMCVKYNTLPVSKLHEQQLLICVFKFVFLSEHPPVFVRNNCFSFNDEVRQYNA